MELYCKQCNEKLTQFPLIKANEKELNYRDQQELLKEGTYIQAVKATFNFKIPIDFLVHSKSIILKDHSDIDRLAGCCGPSEFDVLNQVCPNCSTEIGIRIADCWLPSFIAITMSRVSRTPIW